MMFVKYGEGKFIIVFTSNYHAYYIEELLKRHSIDSIYKKAPRAIARSCNSAVYLSKEEDLHKALELMKHGKIPFQGVFEIHRYDKQIEYQKVLL